jgi:hypothetical protein
VLAHRIVLRPYRPGFRAPGAWAVRSESDNPGASHLYCTIIIGMPPSLEGAASHFYTIQILSAITMILTEAIPYDYLPLQFRSRIVFKMTMKSAVKIRQAEHMNMRFELVVLMVLLSWMWALPTALYPGAPPSYYTGVSQLPTNHLNSDKS